MDHPPTNQATYTVSFHILAGEHSNNAWCSFGFLGVDAPKPRVGVGAAHKIGVRLLRQVDVVCVVSKTRDETLVFFAWHSGANTAIAHLEFLPWNNLVWLC